uniref:C2H2-type domain-containing protein n=1 Tax=Theileria parva TaxID=5875 RepID=Q4N8W7_THEPA|eukprot:XP_765874.1 hypothetical protein [Theileria parva strain Muguga]
MCGLFQPTCQVRFTNVAIVRLKVKGERFEIACYKNKVFNWKSGIENDIEERCVNYSIGKLANNKQLLTAFNTTDINVIIKQILDKGEYQVSKEEREQLLKSIFNDIITILHEITINPQTGNSLSRTMLENALKSSGFSISLNKSTKIQSLKALQTLQQKYPNLIQRCKMKLKLNFQSSQYYQVLSFINNHNASNHLTDSSENFSASSESSSPQQRGGESADDIIIESKNNDSMTVICFPNLYKNLENFIQNELDPPGNIQLVTLNIKQNVNNANLQRNLSSENSFENTNPFAEASPDTLTKLQMINMEQDKTELVTGESKDSNFTVPESSKGNKSISNGDEKFKCKKCNVVLTSGEYKSHFKSNYHIFNLKRLLNNQTPITLDEYNMLVDN